MDKIVTYLTKDELPTDPEEKRRTRIRAARFSIINGELYKRSFSGPYLKCLRKQESEYVMAEIHEGQCGNHSGGRSLAHKALTAGYYWPTMRSDSQAYVRKCDKCQRFAKIPHIHPEPLHCLSTPWPFMKWGLDIVGKLPKAPGQKEYLLAATDYFTKWVEAEAYSQIRDKEVESFLWKNIICKFGVPRELVTDNGSQFISQKFKDYCSEWKIKVSYSTPRYPQANGQAESTNKTIIGTLKKRLESAKGKWVDELPGTLWSYRTTPRVSTGETPFALTYGYEAVIPAEIGEPTMRVSMGGEDNDEAMAMSMDLLEEKRDQAQIRNAEYRRRLAKYYDKRVVPRSFNMGDLVLRKVQQNTRELNAGKLGPNWEGPYKVTGIAGKGAYQLTTMEGQPVRNSWNAIHLRKYFM